MITNDSNDLTAQFLREFPTLSESDQQLLITLMRRLNWGEISEEKFSESLRDAMRNTQ